MGRIVVRIKAAALCAADLDPYHGRQHAGVGTKGHGSVIPGHQGCGLVEKVGPGVDSVIVGDRVAVYTFVSCNHCNGCRAGEWMFCKEAKCFGFDMNGADAELLLTPARNCLKIPAWMDFIDGSLTTDLLGTTYSAAKKLEVGPFDNVAIFGMGPIGVCEAMVCKSLGAAVIGIDPVKERLQHVKKLGCDYTLQNLGDVNVVESINSMLGDEAVSKSIDCSGSAIAESEALECVAPHGKVAFVGWGHRTEIKPVEQVITKDLTIRGSWYFNIADFDEMIRLVNRKKIRLAETVTHRFPLAKASEAFQLFDSKKTLKTVLLP